MYIILYWKDWGRYSCMFVWYIWSSLMPCPMYPYYFLMSYAIFESFLFKYIDVGKVISIWECFTVLLNECEYFFISFQALLCDDNERFSISAISIGWRPRQLRQHSTIKRRLIIALTSSCWSTCHLTKETTGISP